MLTAMLILSLAVVPGAEISVDDTVFDIRYVVAKSGATGWDYYSQAEYPSENVAWPVFVQAFSESNSIPNTPQAHQTMQPGVWGIPWPKAEIVPTEIVPALEVTSTEESAPAVATSTEITATPNTNTEEVLEEIQILKNILNRNTNAQIEKTESLEDQIEQLQQVVTANEATEETSYFNPNWIWALLVLLTLAFLAILILLILYMRAQRQLRHLAVEQNAWQEQAQNHLKFYGENGPNNWRITDPESFTVFPLDPRDHNRVIMTERGELTSVAMSKLPRHIIMDIEEPTHK